MPIDFKTAPIYRDPDPTTGRRVITVAEWHLRPDSLIDEYAYWYSFVAAGAGADPWELLEGIDARSDGRYDVDFVNGTYAAVAADQKIYVSPKHYALLLSRPQP